MSTSMRKIEMIFPLKSTYRMDGKWNEDAGAWKQIAFKLRRQLWGRNKGNKVKGLIHIFYYGLLARQHIRLVLDFPFTPRIYSKLFLLKSYNWYEEMQFQHNPLSFAQKVSNFLKIKSFLPSRLSSLKVLCMSCASSSLKFYQKQQKQA